MYEKLFAIFNKAREIGGLKQPALRFGDIKIRLAGQESRNPGALYVVGKARGQSSEYLGKVSPDGKWQPTPSGREDHVTALMAHLETDPVAHAVQFGKRVGSCCFCGLLLTDERSVAAGYGPFCAGRWGLPWGEESNAERKLRKLRELERQYARLVAEQSERADEKQCGTCGSTPVGSGCYRICPNSDHYYSQEQERADDPWYGHDDARERYADETLGLDD